MILIDANLLIYAYDESSQFHAAARQWMEDVIGLNDPVRLSWTSIHAFLRIMTQRSLFARALTTEQAIGVIQSWLDEPTVGILEPGPRYWSLFTNLLRGGQAHGNLVMDAHLAALAIEHGATLCTTDRDFRRFDGVRLLNPLK